MAGRPSIHDRILRVAHDLFYRDGIRATGIDRVIGESEVSKVTFYRHFHSKNELVLAFLDHRHQRWMTWFADALCRNGGTAGGGAAAVVPALAEWFRDGAFRGCAFINSVVELGGDFPEVAAIARRHKDEMTEAIGHLLPPSERRENQAQAIALAVDGAIMRAQVDGTPDAALEALGLAIDAITPPYCPPQ
ncbi:TetR/AcrR family transcriptional regulator [Magnetospirillum sp. 15-1]|uniref:TetR/AcrR family transcriptional regulator n=1 Tax=Magnetospirillum sp. 15-1 TaxID=1979370 RepID=UPI000BBC98CC|nr:TetR/AcrR family transcriptional regulator [Magnetospirillum sp. 15-1]